MLPNRFSLYCNKYNPLSRVLCHWSIFGIRSQFVKVYLDSSKVVIIWDPISHKLLRSGNIFRFASEVCNCINSIAILVKLHPSFFVFLIQIRFNLSDVNLIRILEMRTYQVKWTKLVFISTYFDKKSLTEKKWILVIFLLVQLKHFDCKIFAFQGGKRHLKTLKKTLDFGPYFSLLLKTLVPI